LPAIIADINNLQMVAGFVLVVVILLGTMFKWISYIELTRQQDRCKQAGSEMEDAVGALKQREELFSY
jgi:hypothetical protein